MKRERVDEAPPVAMTIVLPPESERLGGMTRFEALLRARVAKEPVLPRIAVPRPVDAALPPEWERLGALTRINKLLSYFSDADRASIMVDAIDANRAAGNRMLALHAAIAEPPAK